MTVRCRVCHDELLKACAELGAARTEAEQLLKQNRQLHAKLAKLQSKMAHHLRERDRYRDLYLNATSKLSP